MEKGRRDGESESKGNTGRERRGTEGRRGRHIRGECKKRQVGTRREGRREGVEGCRGSWHRGKK